MDVFDHNDFRSFVTESLQKMPKGGHGQGKKIAQALGISTAFFSQILREKRQISLEQASLLCEYLGLGDLQTEYFLCLVQIDRAGNESLRRQLKKQLARHKTAAQSVAKRFANATEISDADKPVYYSDWVYVAVQQCTAIDRLNSEYKIAEHLSLPLKRVKEVTHFLLQAGLCVEKNGALGIGPARIHLSPDSPWIKQHHANWRNRAVEYLHSEDPNKLHYSSPMTLAHRDFEKIRSKLVAIIEEVGKMVDPSPSEELACLNLDWFKLGC